VQPAPAAAEAAALQQDIGAAAEKLQQQEAAAPAAEAPAAPAEEPKEAPAAPAEEAPAAEDAPAPEEPAAEDKPAAAAEAAAQPARRPSKRASRGGSKRRKGKGGRKWAWARSLKLQPLRYASQQPAGAWHLASSVPSSRIDQPLLCARAGRLISRAQTPTLCQTPVQFSYPPALLPCLCPQCCFPAESVSALSACCCKLSVLAALQAGLYF